MQKKFLHINRGNPYFKNIFSISFLNSKNIFQKYFFRFQFYFFKNIFSKSFSKIKFQKIFFAIIFFSFSLTKIFAQQIDWQVFKKNDNVNCRLFETDALGDIFVATTRNEILKFDDTGYFEGSYSNKKYGTITSIDATIPFKFLMYFGDFQTIMLIDRILNPIVTISLNDFSVSQVQGVSAADDGTIWVYDAGARNFLKFFLDNNTIKLDATFPINNSNRFNCEQMLVNSSGIYINDTQKGIFHFDLFGRLIEQLDVKNALHFQIMDNAIYYSDATGFYVYQITGKTKTLINMPEGVDKTQVKRLQKNKLYVQRGGSIDVYKK